MPRLTLHATASALVLFLATACGAAQSGTEGDGAFQGGHRLTEITAPGATPTSASPTGSNEPILMTLDESTTNGGFEAGADFEGELRLDKRNCFAVGEYAIVVPEGSNILPDDAGIEIHGTGRFELGDRISGAGTEALWPGPDDVPDRFKVCSRTTFPPQVWVFTSVEPPSNAASASPRPEMECRSQSIGTVDATGVTGEKTLDQLGSLYSKPDEAMSSFEEEDGTGTVYIGPATDAPATVVIRATRSSDGWVVDSISRCS